MIWAFGRGRIRSLRLLPAACTVLALMLASSRSPAEAPAAAGAPAAFGLYRDLPANRPVKQDETGHVAFGRLALRDYPAGLTDAERKELAVAAP